MANVSVWNEGTRSKYGFAMDHARGFEELDVGDWRVLRDMIDEDSRKINDDDIRTFIYEVLAKQIEKWIELGRPDRHEEWQRRAHDHDRA
jgi:hypothetical protein